MDSQAALGLLGRSLHCKPGTLAVAGTKDKRACTCQHLTAWQVLLCMQDAVYSRPDTPLWHMEAICVGVCMASLAPALAALCLSVHGRPCTSTGSSGHPGQASSNCLAGWRAWGPQHGTHSHAVCAMHPVLCETVLVFMMSHRAGCGPAQQNTHDIEQDQPVPGSTAWQTVCFWGPALRQSNAHLPDVPVCLICQVSATQQIACEAQWPEMWGWRR